MPDSSCLSVCEEGEEKTFWVVIVLLGHACVLCLRRSPQVACAGSMPPRSFARERVFSKPFIITDPAALGLPREDPNTSHLELKSGLHLESGLSAPGGYPLSLEKSFSGRGGH